MHGEIVTNAIKRFVSLVKKQNVTAADFYFGELAFTLL